MVRWTLLGIGALALACSSDGDNNSPFGVATSPGTTATATASASGGSTGEGTGSSSGGDTDAGESSTGGAGSTSGDPTTAETTDPGTSSVGTTMSGEETGDVPTGMQPVDGLYSHCLTGRECDPIPALCITINDMNDTPIDGFCSITPCTNAAVDCVPTPGGTALPACMPVTLDGTPTNACALDCSGGATCPTGMTCQNLTVGMICA